ncbi:MAP kinase [Cristinia sonorae]|uniref:MAP kinase n=1 Tax=Cristinia sonorae TaxID=1940300 RepID=A0A8K0URN0_9AGAR|nr:MAP kinase [Cristinia sonorae]
MSDDARSAPPKGPRKRPRILVVNNPGSGSSSEDEKIVNPTYPSYGYQPPGHPSSSQSLLLDRPAQPHSHIPAPLTTDLPPEHRHCYPSSRSNPSNPALSSPSSTSSPAIESTPPPSTPGQSQPPVDLVSEATFRRDHVHPLNQERPGTAPYPSSTPGLFDRLRSHLHGRPSNSQHISARPATSPTTSIPDSYVSPTSAGYRLGSGERVTLLVTADAETLRTVDITGARDAAFIRERIFTKLQISDEDQPRFSIYRTEIGEFAIGEALTDDQLFDLYRNSGDDKGTIKLLVSHSHAPVHEPPPESSLVSPTVNTIPPPVLPQQGLYPPLRPRRPPSKSRRGSISSTSERMPQDVAAAGYEASVSDDLDHHDRETRRSTIRPPPHQQHSSPLPQPPSSYPRPPSPGSFVKSPDRLRAPNSESHSLARAERGHGAALPTPPIQQVTSPESGRFPDENATSFSRHNRTESDAVVDRDRDRNPSVLDPQSEGDRQRRAYQSRELKEREREEPDRPRRNLQYRSKESPSRRKNAHYDADNETQRRKGEGWTVVPPGIPSSDYKKERPTTPQDARPSGSPRFQGSNGFGINISHSRPTPPLPPGVSGESGRHNKRQGKAVPPTWAIAWRGAGPSKNEPKPAQSPTWTTRLMAKSMTDLRGAYKQPPTQSQSPQVPPALQSGRPSQPTSSQQLPIVTRPSTGSSTHSIGTSSTLEAMSPYHDTPTAYGEVPLSQSYDSQSRLAFAQSPISTYQSSRSINGAGYAVGTPPGAGYLGIMSPDGEPYPRPRSAQGSEPPTPPYRSSQSPRTGDFTSPSTIRPSAHYHSSGLSANPSTSSYEDNSYSYSSRPRAARPDAEYNPQPIRSYNTPRSPVTSMSPPVDSRMRDGDRRATPETLPVQRTLSSLPVQEDDSTESTVRRDDYARYLGRLENSSGTLIPSKPRTPSPPRFAPTNEYATPGSSKTMVGFPALDDDDSDSEGGGTIWAKKPDRSGQPPWQNLPVLKPSNGRPVLTPISTDSSPASVPTALPDARDASRPPIPDYIPSPPPPFRMRKQPNSSNNSKRLQNQRTSRFDNNFDYTWAPRPPVEEVFDNLQEYFPEHDVDKPVIEAASGGTSPTSAEPSTLIAVPDTRQPKFRHKKSIRVVAAGRIDRTSRMEPTTVQAQLRKRNTKLWGSRLEEVTSEGKDDLSAATEASPGGAKPIFRWVRGELIGKGTYGKVYLALNATTGEMIAVKQVEMPRTASDRDDSRQISVVEALKLESETLKDLDHPNIVQYLGFEETPTFLSIFLEYVPGGSIASCLRKHGKFDEEVTKSFTSQILGGLEYLHSKGILHRDLKADNILVETSGICKISDFGISKRTDDINMAGAYTSMQGTVFWMAPEVINSQKKGYNSKIDIWSVGCVVFEMWTGQRPWNGQEAMAVLLHLYQTRQGPPVPSEIKLSPLADEFRQLCFAMDPDERPSAAELQQHPYLCLQPDWTFNGFK